MFTGIVEEVGTLRSLRAGPRASVLDIAARRRDRGRRRRRQHPHRRRLPDRHGAARRAGSPPTPCPRRPAHDALRAPAGGPPQPRARAHAALRLGGHLVSGHVDGVGTVRASTPEDNALVVELEAPEAVTRVTVDQGSVAVDGVSLTVVAVAGDRVCASRSSRTPRRSTTLGRLTPARGQPRGRPDRQVRACVRRRAQARRGLTWEKLAEAGF